MKDFTLKPAQRIGTRKPYSPPIKSSRITLKLDNNEGAAVDDSLLEVVRSIDPQQLTRYPDASSLEQSIAERFGVDPSRVIVTNGGDDAIDRACQAMLSPGDLMCTHAPGFEMIPRYAELAGARVVYVDWMDGRFPTGAMVDSIRDETKMVALVSPCNPTGGVIETESIRTIASMARKVGAVVLLDQAYIEFADDDPIDLFLDIPNMVVVRTLSKAMGLAGLRVGYAIGSSEVIGWLRTVGGPYPVSVLSLLIAQKAIERSVQRTNIIEQTIANRARLEGALEGVGARVLPSQANFVLAQFADSQSVWEELQRHGISVRRYSNDDLLRSSLRITVPTNEAQQNQLLNALTTIGGNA